MVETAHAQAPPTAIIVLDGSGSMGGPLPGQKTVKFDLARNALYPALEKVKPSATLGLVVAGHRRRGNCRDVQLVTPPAAGAAPAIAARIEKIGTVGKGPLVSALRRGAKALGPGKAGSMILIHDDADNCRQDPCRAAADIAKTNPGLAIHIITIATNPAPGNAMRCIAKTTGGKLFRARNAEEVTAAVNEAMRLAHLHSGVPASKTPGVAASEDSQSEQPSTEGPSRIRLTASLAPKGQALKQPVYWRVMEAGEEGKVVFEANAARAVTPLPAGSYVVEAGIGLVSQRQDIEVAEKGETVARISLGAGSLDISASASQSGEALTDPFITVRPAVDKTDADAGEHETLWAGRKTDHPIVLPVGTYVVRVEDGYAVKEAPLKLAVGDTVKTDFVMGTGLLELSAVDVEGGAPVDDVTFTVSVDDPDAPGGRREIARTAHTRPNFLLPAGTYYATAKSGTTQVRDRVAIGTGDSIRHAIVLGIGRLSVSADYDPALAPEGMGVSFRIFRDGVQDREVARRNAAAADIDLPQGRYRVEARLGGRSLVGKTAVDVVAGQAAKATVTIEAAQLTVSAASQIAGEPLRWELRDERGHVVLRSLQGAGRPVYLSPGKYQLRSERGGRRTERPLELKGGEKRTLDVSLE